MKARHACPENKNRRSLAAGGVVALEGVSRPSGGLVTNLGVRSREFFGDRAMQAGYL